MSAGSSGRAAWSVAVVLCVLAQSGCALHAGPHAGVALAGPDRAVQGAWGGRVAATVVPSRAGLVVGVDADGTALDQDGARWATGLHLGWGRQPPPRPGALGYELHAELGGELADSTLAPDASLYTGGTGMLLVGIGESRARADVNQSVWVLKPVPQLVGLFSARARRLSACDSDCWQALITVGVGVRVLLTSEYF